MGFFFFLLRIVAHTGQGATKPVWQSPTPGRLATSMAAPSLSSSKLKLVRESRWKLVTPSTDGSSGPSSATKQSSSPTLAMKTPEGITLSLHKSDIVSQQVDAIVNSTTTLLDLDNGALSASVLQTGGDTLQEECQKVAPKGIKHGEVVVTSGGQLPCQFVVHGAASSWTDDQCTEILGKLIANSLSTVHKKKLGSIAIPAIGTGVLRVPPEVVATVMLDELCEFSRLNPQTQLRDVRFVVYPKDDQTVQAFEKELLDRCFAMTVETTEGIQLSLCVSDLADEEVDAIVNSAGTELQLHRGQASRTLVAKGGKTLQEECDSTAPDGIEFGEVVVTSGGQLQCQYVIHGACCCWTNGVDTCKQILGEFLTNTFKAVHDKELESVAFPAIGTGVLQIPPRIVGKVMINELLKFSHQHKETTLKDIRFMLYYTNHVTMQAFNNVLRECCTILPDPPQALKDHFPLPSSWLGMSSVQYFSVDELQTGSSEYQIVANKFKPGTKQIQKIERVQNPRLYRQFMVHKKDMESRSAKPASVEHRLWHGTTETAAQGINIYGFNRSYCGKNG
ncbi:Protein mono-ADP-ribosyltransferase PARP14 [Lamellibrachia satsuma]|nr:Protein mono-ADP-ribosyltransferase PARP14 [Lamellibrachia satsuma]